MGRPRLRLRGNVWHITWGPKNSRQSKTTGCKVEQRRDAEKMLRAFELEMAGNKKPGPLTISGYGMGRWLPGRKRLGLRTYRDDEQRFRMWVEPRIGSLELSEVRPSHLREFVKGLSKTHLAPRSIRHVYALVRTLFADAVAEDLIPATPAVLVERRKEIPGKRDKNPDWRRGAVFRRWEAEMLMADERIAFDRRVLYGALFFTGLRIGEALELHWGSYDRNHSPLGLIRVARSYSTKLREVGVTKSDKERLVPVHTELARALHIWRLCGWEWAYGRAPKGDDLIFPSVHGGHRNAGSQLSTLQDDLRLLKFRPRRLHDMRRSFISWMLSDGVNREWLGWITHGRPGDILGEYTEAEASTLCKQVSKLRLSFKDSVLVSMRRRVTLENEGVPKVSQSKQAAEKLNDGAEITGVAACPGRDSNKRTQPEPVESGRILTRRMQRSDCRRNTKSNPSKANCHTATPSKGRKAGPRKGLSTGGRT